MAFTLRYYLWYWYPVETFDHGRLTKPMSLKYLQFFSARNKIKFWEIHYLPASSCRLSQIALSVMKLDQGVLMQFLTIKMIVKLKLGTFQEEMFSIGKINVKILLGKASLQILNFFSFPLLSRRIKVGYHRIGTYPKNWCLKSFQLSSGDKIKHEKTCHWLRGVLMANLIPCCLPW